MTYTDQQIAYFRDKNIARSPEHAEFFATMPRSDIEEILDSSKPDTHYHNPADPDQQVWGTPIGDPGPSLAW